MIYNIVSLLYTMIQHTETNIPYNDLWNAKCDEGKSIFILIIINRWN